MTNSNFENVQGKKDFRANNNYERSSIRSKFGGKKESGGFRIRLSDNEMKAVKAIQENFQLKSTVAVLGFSVRTLSELIKDSDLKEKITKNAQINKNTSNRFNPSKNNEETKNKTPDPFARPSKAKSEENNDPKIKDINE